MIQLRHVPEELHRKLTARAASAGMSLSDYLIREVAKLSEQPTPDELRRRIAQRSAVTLKTRPADALRAERDGR